MKNIIKLCLVLLPLLSMNVYAGVSVIVHPSNDAKIKKNHIKKIFLGKTKSFSNGKAAIPINLADSVDFRKFFNKKLLNRSNGQVSSHWSKLEFTGTGTQPENKNTDEILTLVASNPDVIAYIDSDAVTSDVKVIYTVE